MKKPSEAEKFYEPRDKRFEEKIEEWKRISRDWESNPDSGYDYPAYRIEGEVLKEGGRRTLESYHQESFLEYIRDVLSKRDQQKDDRPVRVLDVGGGAGLFAEQLRKTFGKRVKVYTTGIKKKASRKLRGYIREEKDNSNFGLVKKPTSFELEVKGHQDDLKWRSILELTDFEEFDLIIDTAGEFSYSAVFRNQFDSMDYNSIVAASNSNKKRIEEYLKIVIKKLRSQGRASIAFIPSFVLDEIQETMDQFKDLADFKIIDNSSATSSREPEYILKIWKR
jgi:hypothetical protein